MRTLNPIRLISEYFEKKKRDLEDKIKSVQDGYEDMENNSVRYIFMVNYHNLQSEYMRRYGHYYLKRGQSLGLNGECKKEEVKT
jgi:hypothetical protein